MATEYWKNADSLGAQIVIGRDTGIDEFNSDGSVLHVVGVAEGACVTEYRSASNGAQAHWKFSPLVPDQRGRV